MPHGEQVIHPFHFERLIWWGNCTFVCVHAHFPVLLMKYQIVSSGPFNACRIEAQVKIGDLSTALLLSPM